jgi:hypothetical protein
MAAASRDLRVCVWLAYFCGMYPPGDDFGARKVLGPGEHPPGPSVPRWSLTAGYSRRARLGLSTERAQPVQPSGTDN